MRHQLLATNSPAILCLFAGLILSGCSDSTSLTTVPEGLSADEVLSKMAAKYRSAKTYIDNAQCVEQSVLRGEDASRELPYFQLSIAFERPGKLRLKREESIAASSGRVSYDVASNGKIIRCQAAELPEQIHETAAPDELTPDNFIPANEFRAAVLEVSIENIFPQLAMLMSPDSQDSIFPETNKPRLMEQGDLDGAMHYRVALTSTEGTRVLWVDTQTFALRRMEIPTENQRRLLDPEDQYSHLTFWIDFQHVTFDAQIDPETFDMDIPEGARRVSQLIEPPPAGMPPQVGKPVGNYSFASLEGEPITPETADGKVVVLDFWFTGCPPCKQQTPVLEKIYQQFADSDKVAFYAVSTDRASLPNKQVVDTLRKWGSTMPVLRDAESSGYQELDLRSTPTTIVIGADQRVQLFQAGVHQTPEPLANFIQQVIDGKDFAAEAIAQRQEQLKLFNEKLESVTLTD